MRRVKNICKSIKYLLFNIIGLLCGYIVPVPEHLWLFAERGFDARDNGYWMYKFVIETHPEIHAAYVIQDESRDSIRITKGEKIRPGSWKHYRYLMHAEALISSYDCGYTPDMTFYHRFVQHKLFHPHGKIILLQHGIHDKVTQEYMRKECKPDVLIVSAEEEQNNLIINHHQPESVIKQTGLARYDQLIPTSSEKMILIMPTKRNYLVNLNPYKFKRSKYSIKYRSLIALLASDPEIQKAGYHIVFYPHSDMQKYYPVSSNRNVRIASDETDDVQDLLKRCDMLITDYSSIYFDVAYMQKPVIFFQFDQEEFTTKHHVRPAIEYAEFGPVINQEREIMIAVRERIYGTAILPDTQAFYTFHDRHHCERIFDAIQQCIQ